MRWRLRSKPPIDTHKDVQQQTNDDKCEMSVKITSQRSGGGGGRLSRCGRPPHHAITDLADAEKVAIVSTANGAVRPGDRHHDVCVRACHDRDSECGIENDRAMNRGGEAQRQRTHTRIATRERARDITSTCQMCVILDTYSCAARKIKPNTISTTGHVSSNVAPMIGTCWCQRSIARRVHRSTYSATMTTIGKYIGSQPYDAGAAQNGQRGPLVLCTLQSAAPPAVIIEMKKKSKTTTRKKNEIKRDEALYHSRKRMPQ